MLSWHITHAPWWYYADIGVSAAAVQIVLGAASMGLVDRVTRGRPQVNPPASSADHSGGNSRLIDQYRPTHIGRGSSAC